MAVWGCVDGEPSHPGDRHGLRPQAWLGHRARASSPGEREGHSKTATQLPASPGQGSPKARAQASGAGLTLVRRRGRGLHGAPRPAGGAPREHCGCPQMRQRSDQAPHWPCAAESAGETGAPGSPPSCFHAEPLGQWVCCRPLGAGVPVATNAHHPAPAPGITVALRPFPRARCLSTGPAGAACGREPSDLHLPLRSCLSPPSLQVVHPPRPALGVPRAVRRPGVRFSSQSPWFRPSSGQGADAHPLPGPSALWTWHHWAQCDLSREAGTAPGKGVRRAYPGSTVRAQEVTSDLYLLCLGRVTRRGGTPAQLEHPGQGSSFEDVAMW